MDETFDSRRLQFVASNFLALQGLRQVALGVMLLFTIPALALDYPWNILLFMLLLLSLGIATWRIGIYYERRFGHVERRRVPVFWGDGQSFARRTLFWLAVVLVSAASMKMFNVKILTAGWFLGILFAGFFALENRRWYYLLFAGSFFLLEILKLVPDHKRLMIEIWTLPFAFIITGILDHVLLVRLLPGVQPDGTA